MRVLPKAVLGAWVLATLSNTLTFHLCVVWVESLGRGCSELSSKHFLYKVDKGTQVQAVESNWSIHHTGMGMVLPKECTDNHITPPSLVASSN